MKSIMRAASVLAMITATTPGIANVSDTNCSGPCDGVGTIVTNNPSSASSSDEASKAIGELVGDKTLSTVTTIVATHAPLDETTRSAFVSGMATAGGALNSDVRPTVEAAMGIGGSLGGGIGSGTAGTTGLGTALGGALGPVAALGGALGGLASGH